MTEDNNVKSIKRAATILHGIVDGWKFKQYFLGFLAFRFLSEKIEAGKDIGLSLPRDLFFRSIFLYKKNEKTEAIKKAFKILDEWQGTGATSVFSSLNFESENFGEEKEEKINKIMQAVNSVSIKKENGDAFGDAYEHIMSTYATRAGRKSGEFFTPAALAELAAEIATEGNKEARSVYDMACGSGHLLISAAKKLKKVEKIHGQEINMETQALCVYNMILRDIPRATFDIIRGDTLSAPGHAGPYDIVIANPPFSTHWKGKNDEKLRNDKRFSGTAFPPPTKADFAFVLHAISALGKNGIAVIIMFPPALVRSGAEAKIRKCLIINNYVDSVIAVPGSMFANTRIPTCILTLKKNKTRNGALFFDARDFYEKKTQTNTITKENIKKIVEVYKTREHDKAKIITNEELEKNGYKLSPSLYFLEREKAQEKIDIKKITEKIDELKKEREKREEETQKTIEKMKETKEKIKEMILEQAPEGAKVKKLWKVTKWAERPLDLKERKKLSIIKEIKIKNYTAKLLKSLNDEEGEIPLYTNGPWRGKTTREKAGNMIMTGDYIIISKVEPVLIRHVTGEFMIANNNIGASNDTSALLNRYLYFFLKMKKKTIKTTGTTMQNTRIGPLLSESIPIPSLKIQTEIIAALEPLEEIEKIQIQEEEKLLRARNEYYLQDFFDFPIFEDEKNKEKRQQKLQFY